MNCNSDSNFNTGTNKNIRSAETTRKASCEFANIIATAAIEKYKDITPLYLQKIYKQTVLSSFLLYNSENNDLSVISFGVGTKFMTWNTLTSAVTEEVPKSDPGNLNSKYINTVHDCHAEILARRGLLQYFYDSISTVLSHVESDTLDQLPQDVIFTYNPPTTGFAPFTIFQCFSLKSQYSIHFYTSSQPCGNASWKNWGKSRTTVLSGMCLGGGGGGGYGDLKIPDVKHPLFHCSAVEEGQVECLVKRDHTYTHALDCTAVDMDHSQFKVPPGGTSFPFHVGVGGAGGAASHSRSTGVIMTCSDKIAKWCNVGVQGSLLSYLIYSNVPVSPTDPGGRSGLYINTVTVGRKYSEVHLQRALCCRTRGFQFQRDCDDHVGTRNLDSNSCMVSYSVHHPTTLCTSVKFDTGAIVTGAPTHTDTDQCQRGEIEHPVEIGAKFNESRCVMYWKSQPGSVPLGSSSSKANFEIIDGYSGLISDSGIVSQVAPVSFLKQFTLLWNRVCVLHSIPGMDAVDIDRISGPSGSLASYVSLKKSIGASVGAASAPQIEIKNPYWLAKEKLCYSNIRSRSSGVAELELEPASESNELSRDGSSCSVEKSSKISRKSGQSYKSVHKKCLYLNMYTSVKKQLLQAAVRK